MWLEFNFWARFYLLLKRTWNKRVIAEYTNIKIPQVYEYNILILISSVLLKEERGITLQLKALAWMWWPSYRVARGSSHCCTQTLPSRPGSPVLTSYQTFITAPRIYEFVSADHRDALLEFIVSAEKMVCMFTFLV